MAYITNATTNFLIKADNFVSGINLSKMVAKRAETLLLGNGYSLEMVEGSSEVYLEAYDAILKDQGLIGLLSDTERNLSLYGEQGVIIDFSGGVVQKVKGEKKKIKTKRNIRFSLCEQQSRFYTTTSGKIIGARTYRKVTWGDGVYQIMEVWNNRGVKRTITNSQGNSIPIAEFNSKVSPEMQVTESWNYGAITGGEIPIILFQNLNSVGNKSEADGENAKVIQQQLDHALFTLYKETEMTRTRYGIDYGQEQTIKDIKQNGLYQTIRDSVIMTDTDGAQDGESTPAVQVLANEFRGAEYVDTIKFFKNMYFEAAGYSPIDDTVAQDTVAGTLFTNKQDMETTRKKLKIREAQLESFSNMVCLLLGLNIKVHIKLKANIMYDEQSRMDYIRSGEEFGIMTIEDKVKLFYNLQDEEEIKEKVEAIKKEEKERMEMFDEQGQEAQNKQEGNKPDNNNGGEEKWKMK